MDGWKEGSGPGKSRNNMRAATILLVMIVIVCFPDTPAQTDTETQVDRHLTASPRERDSRIMLTVFLSEFSPKIDHRGLPTSCQICQMCHVCHVCHMRDTCVTRAHRHEGCDCH